MSDLAKDLVTKLLHPDPTKRLNADEALAHEWIALRGISAGDKGDLKAAQALLKQQVAQKRLTALWHLLDIMNTLDASAPTASRNGATKAPKLPPRLAKRASEASSASLLSHPRTKDGAARPRQGSHTDRIEELQHLFNLFDTDKNGEDTWQPTGTRPPF